MIKKLIWLFIILIIIYLIYQFWPIKHSWRQPSPKTINKIDCLAIPGGLTPVCRGIWMPTICREKTEIYDKEICSYCETKCFGVLTYEIPR